MENREKIMPLDLLSGIKDARSSEAVDELFKVIMRAVPDVNTGQPFGAGTIRVVSMENLRDDEVAGCPEEEKELIRKNFAKTRDGYLVVPKVIDD